MPVFKEEESLSHVMNERCFYLALLFSNTETFYKECTLCQTSRKFIFFSCLSQKIFLKTPFTNSTLSQGPVSSLLRFYVRMQI